MVIEATSVQQKNNVIMASPVVMRSDAHKNRSLKSLFELPTPGEGGETHCEVWTRKSQSRGTIECDAMEVTSENGMIIRKYGLMMGGGGGSWRKDLVSVVARATDKALLQAHREGLAKLRVARPELFTAE